MIKLTVKTEKPYPVCVSDGTDVFKYLRDLLSPCPKIAVVTDENVDGLYPDWAGEALFGLSVFKYVLPAGEKCKTAQNYLDVLGFLIEKGFTRFDGIVAFGGGAVSDLAGFVASTYMRGIKYVIVPTTVLSMTDASVGGKTAIDLGGVKNSVGTFYQPECVFISTPFFATLPEREITSGYGEIIKYSFLTDDVTEKDILAPFSASLVAKCLARKIAAVEADIFDRGERRLLNFGHTFGHAVETLSGFTLSHGECVVKGIAYALKISHRKSLLNDADYTRLYDRLSLIGHDPECKYKFSELNKVLLHDKKYDGENLQLVLLNEQAKPFIKSVGIDELTRIFKDET